MAIDALGSTVGQGVKEQGRTLVLPTLDFAVMYRAALAAVKGICSPISTTPSLSVSTQVRIVLVLESFKAN